MHSTFSQLASCYRFDWKVTIVDEEALAENVFYEVKHIVGAKIL